MASQTTTSGSGDASVSRRVCRSTAQPRGIRGSADIDTAHVESIKQAIKDGSLKFIPARSPMVFSTPHAELVCKAKPRPRQRLDD